MKKFLLFTVMAVVAVLTLQSCSKDDDDNSGDSGSKTYTASFGAKAELSGNLATYYHPVMSVTIKNANGTETKTGELGSTSFEVNDYATPCTFTYTITFKKLSDFDTTQEYTLDCEITSVGASVNNNYIHTEGINKNTVGFSGMKGTEVEGAMDKKKFSGTITVNSDGSVSKGE